MRRLTIALLSMCLVGIGSAAVAAPQDELVVVRSTASTDSELSELFPVSVAGQPLAVQAWSGADWLARFDSGTPDEAVAIAATESLVAAAGTTLDELEVATTSIDLSPDAVVTVSAVRIRGSRAYDFVDAAFDMLAVDIVEPWGGWNWVSNRWTALYLDTTARDAAPVVVYPAGDTVWVIDADLRRDEPIDRYTVPIVTALPPQPGPIGPIVSLTQRVEAPELGIAASFPEDWTVESLPPDPDARPAAILGGLSATGPEDARLGAAPVCGLRLFGPTEMSPRAWISRAIEGNRCYVVDETPDGLVRARIQPGDCGREWAPSQGGAEYFALGRHGDVAFLGCWSKEPPGERGTAIAESIEFLPGEEE